MKDIRQIGIVGVDSGQLLLTDPCYIDNEWVEEDFQDDRVYQHKETGDKLYYKKDFDNYEQVIDKYGKTMNELNGTGDWRELNKRKVVNNFSYNACCDKTLREDMVGQLNYKMGHPGVGVVFLSGYGDGEYPVMAEYKDGRIKKVWIEFF